MEMKEIAALNERLREHILSLAKAESWKRNGGLIAESIASRGSRTWAGSGMSTLWATERPLPRRPTRNR